MRAAVDQRRRRGHLEPQSDRPAVGLLPVAPATMELRRYQDGDFGLTQALETDPVTMRELGGPTDRASLRSAHRRRCEDPWWFTIVPQPSGPAVGTIGIWASQLDGSAIFETGWMVLPVHQGRGIASAALALLIERVRAEPRLDRMHAFPAVGNGPSNALCRRAGFTLLGERELDYAGHRLHCSHWALATEGLGPSGA